jgi:hypothetical protein
MIAITESNLYRQPFKNVREILLTNTNGYKVTPSYSKNATLPVIILNDSEQQLGKRFSSSASGKYNIQIDVECVCKTATSAATLAQELFTLLKAAAFDAYNMELTDIAMFTNNVDIEGSRLHIRTIVCQFYVD